MEDKKVIYLNIMPRPRTKHPNYTLPIVLAIIAAIMSIAAITQVHNVFFAAEATPKEGTVTAEEHMPRRMAAFKKGAIINHTMETDAVPVEKVKVRVHTPEAEETEKTVETGPSYISFDVPTDYESNTGFKAYMDYRAITSKRSLQYALQQEAYTDPDTGIRMYDGCYMVALGTFYAQQAGERFRITLEDGTAFNAITGDIKADAHTDANHQHRNGSIVEFVVDTRTISQTCKRMGDMSYAGFRGQIKSVEKLVDPS